MVSICNILLKTLPGLKINEITNGEEAKFIIQPNELVAVR